MHERVFASKFLARTQSLVTQIMVALRVNDDDGLAAQNGREIKRSKQRVLPEPVVPMMSVWPSECDSGWKMSSSPFPNP